MATGIGPYVVSDPNDTDPAAAVLETTITAAHTMVNIGGGLMASAETFNEGIPGPTLRLNVGDTMIVRLVNELDHPPFPEESPLSSPHRSLRQPSCLHL